VLAAFTWAIVNVVNKFVISKWARNLNILVVSFGVVSLLSSIFFFALRGFTTLSAINTLIAIATGVLYFLTVFFYYKALEIEEVSRVIPLYNLTPLFVLLFAGIFLEEVFTLTKYVGIFLIVAGALFVSSKEFKRIRFGRAFRLMVLATIISATVHVLTKYLLNFSDFWTIFAYIRIGTFLIGFPILFFRYDDISRVVRQQGKKVVGLISFNNVLNLLGVLFFTIAVSKGFVSLVNALSSVQPLFVLLFTVILTLVYPHILKEKVDKVTIVKKTLAIVLMLTGAVLIT